MSDFDKILKHTNKPKANEAHDWRAQGAKPCPYCGSDDITMEAPEVMPGDPKTFVTVCGSCGAQGPYKESEKAAVDEWNRVASAVKPQKESKVNEDSKDELFNKVVDALGKANDETIKNLYKKLVPEMEVNAMSDRLIDMARGDDATLKALAKELGIEK